MEWLFVLNQYQRLDDYWLGLRLQKMDIPAIHLVSSNEDLDDSSPLMASSLVYI